PASCNASGERSKTHASVCSSVPLSMTRPGVVDWRAAYVELVNRHRRQGYSSEELTGHSLVSDVENPGCFGFDGLYSLTLIFTSIYEVRHRVAVITCIMYIRLISIVLHILLIIISQRIATNI
ncbi:hypothetical protein ACJX0J_008379, partial [Zea mays]